MRSVSTSRRSTASRLSLRSSTSALEEMHLDKLDGRVSAAFYGQPSGAMSGSGCRPPSKITARPTGPTSTPASRLLELASREQWRAIVDTFRTLCSAPPADVSAAFDALPIAELLSGRAPA